MRTKLFIDTNVMLDLLGDRHPFYEPASEIATLADQGEIIITVSPISFTTINYFLSKFESSQVAIEKLRKFKVLCEVCQINELTIEKALNSEFVDFEDATQYYCALNAKSDIIITRDIKHFKKSEIPIMTPDEYLASYNLS